MDGGNQYFKPKDLHSAHVSNFDGLTKNQHDVSMIVVK
jgi:hypothetical protein